MVLILRPAGSDTALLINEAELPQILAAQTPGTYRLGRAEIAWADSDAVILGTTLTGATFVGTPVIWAPWSITFEGIGPFAAQHYLDGNPVATPIGGPPAAWDGHEWTIFVWAGTDNPGGMWLEPGTVRFPEPSVAVVIPPLDLVVGDAVDLDLREYFDDHNPDPTLTGNSLTFQAVTEGGRALAPGLSIEGRRLVGTLAGPVSDLIGRIDASNSGGSASIEFVQDVAGLAAPSLSAPELTGSPVTSAAFTTDTSGGVLHISIATNNAVPTPADLIAATDIFYTSVEFTEGAITADLSEVPYGSEYFLRAVYLVPGHLPSVVRVSGPHTMGAAPGTTLYDNDFNADDWNVVAGGGALLSASAGLISPLSATASPPVGLSGASPGRIRCTANGGISIRARVPVTPGRTIRIRSRSWWRNNIGTDSAGRFQVRFTDAANALVGTALHDTGAGGFGTTNHYFMIDVDAAVPAGAAYIEHIVGNSSANINYTRGDWNIHDLTILELT